MRDEAIIALILVLVIASAGAGYYVGNSSKQTVTSTETSLLTSTTTEIPSANGTCGHPLYPAGNSTMLSDVVQILPNSTGLVCVTYSVDPQQAQEFQKSILPGGEIYLLGGKGVPPVARGVNLTVISAVIAQSNETVEYQMQTSGNSTGAYTWWAAGKCPGFPLVIGSNASSAEPALKQYYSGNFYCPEFFFGAVLDGLSGISVVNVTI